MIATHAVLLGRSTSQRDECRFFEFGVDENLQESEAHSCECSLTASFWGCSYARQSVENAAPNTVLTRLWDSLICSRTFCQESQGISRKEFVNGQQRICR